MKRLIFVLFFLIFAAAVCFSQSAGSTMYVAVKSADLKKGTGFFAGKIGTLALGESVTVVSVSGKWLQVRTTKNLTGWAASDSFTNRRVVSAGSASASEVALAGKGFSAEAEVEYRKDGLNYTSVDAVEKLAVSLEELEKFVNSGSLKRGD